MASSPQTGDNTEIDVDPMDHVERIDGVLRTVCCHASVAMDSGCQAICADCGETITDGLQDTRYLLGVE